MRFPTNLLQSSVMLMMYFGILLPGTQPARGQDDLPGSQEAIEQAVAKSVSEAVAQMTATLTGEINSVTVVPLFNDADRFVTDALQHELIQQGAILGFRVLTRDDKRWDDLLAEFEFSEDNFDIMAAGEVSEFGKLLGTDAIIWGKVNHREIDDSGLKGHASLQVYLGVVETGQIAASGRGNQKVLIDAETGLLWLLQQPWALGLIVIGVVAAIAFIIIMIPLKRKMALAAKPREIIR